MKYTQFKKIILLFFLSLFFSSSSYAGIENWADTSVCLWLKSSGGGNPVPLAEAKKRGISCKDGKVIKSQQKSSKIQIELAASVYAKTSNQLLCNWVKTYPNNQGILKEYRGWFNAFLWQSFAKAYDHDLRTLYDPINIKEDNYIELIIKKEFKK